MTVNTVRHLTASVQKSKASGSDGTFALSTEDRDSTGDIILQDGWDLERFKSNPIALWQHDHKNPIGTWSNFRIEKGRLIADLKLATTNLALMAKKLLDEGVLKAVSVGLRVLDYEPIDKKEPYGAWLIKKAELLEASLVSVPANPYALQISKSLNLNSEERALVFSDKHSGKSAIKRMPALAKAIGKLAEIPQQQSDKSEDKTMTLSERIEAKQKEINALRDRLQEITLQYAEDASEENETELEEVNSAIDAAQAQFEKLQKAERSIAATLERATEPAPEGTPNNPATAPRLVHSVKNPEPGELLFRQASVQFLAHVSKTSVADVMRDRYRNDKELEAIIKAAVAPGDTTTAAWAANLLEQQVESFVDLLSNNSVYGALRSRGMSINFAGAGSIKIPSRDASPTLNGDFVGEGAPIPVKKAGFSAQTLTRHKVACIVAMTEELIDATNSQIETIVRQGILDDTSKIIDSKLMDSTAGDTVRPAGLLNGVTPTASAGDTSDNIITDLKVLLAPFTLDDAAKDIVMPINRARLIGVSTVTNAVGTMVFKEDVARGDLFGMAPVVSGNVATDEVHSIAANEFITAYGGPSFKVSDVATLHMEDTSPAEIVSSVPATANPVRSLFQTNTVAIKMTLPITWAMRRASMIASLSSVSW